MAFAATVTANQADAARHIVAAADDLRAPLPLGTIMALLSAPLIAPRSIRREALELFGVRVMRLTRPAGLAGLPQVSLPIGTVAGRPAGLSLIGWAGGDEALLDGSSCSPNIAGWPPG